MKARYFIIVFLTIILIGLVVAEQLFVRSTIDLMQQETESLKTELTSAENINSQNLIDKINYIDKTWTDKENILCLIVNHKDMEKVGEQIEKLKVLIPQNQKQQAEQEMELLIYYIDGYEHFVSISFQNLF